MTETMDERRRARRWIAIASLPVVLAGLLLAAKLISLAPLAHSAISSHARGDGAGTIAAAEWLQPVNWFEPWKAPYDLGVGLAGADRLAEARGEFERALPLATGLDTCPVRINLALVLERLGDAARATDPDRAAALYAEATRVSSETPPACRSDRAREESPDPRRDPGQVLDELMERLRQKQSEPPPAPEPEGETGDLGDIEEQLRDGQEARDELEGGQDEPGSGVEKPW